MFIRKKKNKSGVISVQIIDTSSGRPKLFKTIGSSSDEKEVKGLVKQGQNEIAVHLGQASLRFDWQEDRQFLNHLRTGLKQVQVIGPELVLGKLFDEIGFNQISDKLFRQLVIARLIYPLSKLKTTEYLMRYTGKHIDIERVYRFLDKLNARHKDQIQRISYEHTLKVLGNVLSVVFYDVTTLYFEASQEGELRKIGFSKDNKAQNPQIVLGLLVSQHGYPLAYEMFEGNKFEGHTMLPILDAFKAKYKLQNLTIVADAGLLSKNNIEQLKEGKYQFILGGRLKNESKSIQAQVLSHVFKDGESVLINKNDTTKLIVSYAKARAKKDAYNRKRGLQKLEQSIRSGRLNKQHINNRGYNKYLQLKGEIEITIDYEKFKEDAKWDGLKGYITNTQLPKQEIIDNYKHLWYIEKAFRVSKTDLKVRPIYHRLKHRIEAHLSIAFCAYKIYKELERQLKTKKSELSPEKVIELTQSIYAINLILPKSGENGQIIFAGEPNHERLLKWFNIKIDS
jgi:transposase